LRNNIAVVDVEMCMMSASERSVSRVPHLLLISHLHAQAVVDLVTDLAVTGQSARGHSGSPEHGHHTALVDATW
jgi:hypothetical protein